MRDIHCPKDIGFNNIFIGEDCKKEQWYDNCYHCWSSAIVENNQKYFKRKFEEELENIKEEITRWCNGYLQEEIDKDINKIIDKHIAELKGGSNDENNS